uniref:NADH-ubiquinone oxidoreductase chain 3 n=1 Tax=Imasa heleensis TaxID=2772037 RepID=A0A893DD98_9EUKA|nr:NADH dehydrogenase subunit 3 [Imasa heleensis]QRR29733.1 NADH dehydrogenase subunit 3 [Imasa heleensis]
MRLVWMDYLSIIIYLIFSIVVSIIILGLSYLVSVQKSDAEKTSAYECGFSPFDDARTRFDVKFYLVAILFIIFDLEVSFLFPWVTVLDQIGSLGFWSMFWFLLILTIGFVYEWAKGALDWN